MANHWFEPMADHLGAAYLNYSFTRGTVREVEAILAMTGQAAGAAVLDVGCGPGRHALEFGHRGFQVTGIDISETFIELGRAAAEKDGADVRFEVGDARALGYRDRFDLAISLCQGGFGLTGGPAADQALSAGIAELDEPVLAGMARAVVPGGWLVVSAFSAYFQLRFAEEGDDFDADLGVNHETTTIRNSAGEERPASLWTTCYTPRELRLLARAVGLEVVAVYGVTPGRYGPTPPATDCAEFLLVARRPS